MYELENFKSFANASVDLSRPLTVLIGPNGVGKTNLIEGVELLAVIANGLPLHEVSDVGRGGRFEVRGGLQACPRRPSSSFELSFHGDLDFEGVSQAIVYSVEVLASSTPEIQAERLVVGPRTLIDATRTGSGLLKVTFDNFKRGPNKPSQAVPSSRSLLSQYESFAASGGKFEECSRLVQSLRQYLARSYAFDPHPRLMRGYERIGNGVLQRDGANVGSVLYGLSTGATDQRASLVHIIDRIRQLPEESFDDIAFETTRLNDVLFGLKRADGSMVDARVLSDGTLRGLAVLTALETANPRSRLVVEEFDNGIHPSRVRDLFAAALETARRRQLNVLITTHNPATLDALPDDSLDGVVVAYWSKEEQTAKLAPLSELPRLQELLERGRLGDLVTRRVLEAYLREPSDAERAAQAKAWIEALGAT